MEGSNLLVISHDKWNREMYEMSQSINFMKSLQIIYPKSMHYFQDEFPATNVDDCPVHLSYEKAKEKNCTNREWQDAFSNYRYLIF